MIWLGQPSPDSEWLCSALLLAPVFRPTQDQIRTCARTHDKQSYCLLCAAEQVPSVPGPRGGDKCVVPEMARVLGWDCCGGEKGLVSPPKKNRWYRLRP